MTHNKGSALMISKLEEENYKSYVGTLIGVVSQDKLSLADFLRSYIWWITTSCWRNLCDSINFRRPFSGIPLQFLVMVIGNHTGHCHEKPSFTASTPKDGECSDVPIGSAYSAVIEVQVADFSKSYVYRTRINDQDCLVFHYFFYYFFFHSQTK